MLGPNSIKYQIMYWVPFSVPVQQIFCMQDHFYLVRISRMNSCCVIVPWLLRITLLLSAPGISIQESNVNITENKWHICELQKE